MSILHKNIEVIDQSLTENPFSWPMIDTDQVSLSDDINKKKTFLRLENPSQEQELWDNRAKLKEITAQYAICYLDTQIKNDFFSQIDWLLNSDHWENGDNLANSESFKTLVKFILNAKPNKAPYLGLSDEGNLLASWINDDNKITLECFSDASIKWFISCTFDGKKERVGGETPNLERLLAAIGPFQEAGWFAY